MKSPLAAIRSSLSAVPQALNRLSKLAVASCAWLLLPTRAPATPARRAHQAVPDPRLGWFLASRAQLTPGHLTAARHLAERTCREAQQQQQQARQQAPREQQEEQVGPAGLQQGTEAAALLSPAPGSMTITGPVVPTVDPSLLLQQVESIWVFGFGSLVYNPGFEHSDRLVCFIKGVWGAGAW